MARRGGSAMGAAVAASKVWRDFVLFHDVVSVLVVVSIVDHVPRLILRYLLCLSLDSDWRHRALSHSRTHTLCNQHTLHHAHRLPNPSPTLAPSTLTMSRRCSHRSKSCSTLFIPISLARARRPCW
jgi:hypothetical protein